MQRHFSDYKRLVTSFILNAEGNFTPLVQADFEEGVQALHTEDEQIAYCRRWLKVYRPGRKKR
jgi:hypothetical protein